MNVTKLLIPGQRWKVFTEGRSFLPLTLLLWHPTYLLSQRGQLLQSVVSDSRRVTLLPGLCSPEKAYLLPTASRRPECSEPQGWLFCYSDRWTRRELWLPASTLPGRERESTFCLWRCQTETCPLHLPHYRAKRLLCHSDDIIVLLSQLGWHQFEPLPDRKVCNCRMYFQQGASSIISNIKGKRHEAGTEAEFKVMDERNVQIVCLC